MPLRIAGHVLEQDGRRLRPRVVHDLGQRAHFELPVRTLDAHDLVRALGARDELAHIVVRPVVGVEAVGLVGGLFQHGASRSLSAWSCHDAALWWESDALATCFPDGGETDKLAQNRPGESKPAQREVRMPFVRAVIALCAFLAVAAPRAYAEDPFYKSKRLNLLINFAAGGPSDIEGRLLAKHLVKHLDGAPSIIVQNKDGAGGLIGAGYIGELGPKDGSMFGYVTATAWPYVIDPTTLSRRLQELRVHRLAAGERRLLCSRRRRARDQGCSRHHEGQGPGGRWSFRRLVEGHLIRAPARHARPAATATSPAIAATRRRGSRCSATRSISSRRRRRPISAWSIPA